jgi:signal transduction histidine kinase
LVALVLVAAWALAGAGLAVRRPGEPMGRLMMLWAAIGAAGSLAASGLHTGSEGDLAQLVRALTVTLVPAFGLHLLLALPDGRLVQRWRTVAVCSGHLGALTVGFGLFARRPGLPLWPVVLEALAAAGIGLSGARGRYDTVPGRDRPRMQLVAWALLVAASASLLMLALHLLLDWPAHAAAIAALASLPVPLALAVGGVWRRTEWVSGLLIATIVAIGLIGLVLVAFGLVVAGLGHAPTGRQRTVILLSLVAAAIVAFLAPVARRRLGELARRAVRGQPASPAETLREFGDRLSRAIPLEELLLQLAESLRDALRLSAAEVWTGSGGGLERVASDPERGRGRIVVDASEAEIVAGGGVRGPGWLAVWLRELLVGRDATEIRVAPITSSGELLGLIVAERGTAGEPFSHDDERLLAETAGRMGLALHNVHLDSALQASLTELRRQAKELRASRARVATAADAERRRIERDLHDGAQQALVAMTVNLRLARRLANTDPAQARAVLEQLSADAKEALEDVRNLAHGIYPPLLLDRGLGDALAAAIARGPTRTALECGSIGRYAPDVEATAYFCCLEALQNVGKHAGHGASATVRLREDEGGLLFEVIDDGVGFDVSDPPGGAGLTSMADRVGAIGGSMRIDSTPRGGTRVVGAIPLSG